MHTWLPCGSCLQTARAMVLTDGRTPAEAQEVTPRMHRRTHPGSDCRQAFREAHAGWILSLKSMVNPACNQASPKRGKVQIAR